MVFSSHLMSFSYPLKLDFKLKLAFASSRVRCTSSVSSSGLWCARADRKSQSLMKAHGVGIAMETMLFKAFPCLLELFSCFFQWMSMARSEA